MMDYLIDLFTRNSRDYREVSKKLAKMKSEDKINQQERIRTETSFEPVKLLQYYSSDEFFLIL